MRVLILTADYPPRIWSGIGVAVERQARALATLGVEVHVLVGARTAATAAGSAEGEPIVHHLECARCPVDPRRFDLIHLHSLALSEFAMELQWRFRLPLIYTAHSLLHLELEEAANAEWWCAVQARVLAMSNWVIFLSRSELAAAIAFLPELARRSSVIPNGVPPPTPSPPPTADAPIVFAGRFARSKGVTLLAELVPRILAQRHSRFILAGGHGDALGRSVIRELTTRYPDACQTVGWLLRDDLDRLFARAALVLIPSLYEPFGQIALEAMRVGAPVLAAATGGLAELVGADSGGHTIASHDPEQWSCAVLQLLSAPTLLQQLRQRGPEYTATRFDLRSIAERLRDEVYARRAAARNEAPT